MNALELQCHQDMLDVIGRCEREISYNPAYCSQMVAEQGGVGAARTLLHGPPASDGFTRLWEEGQARPQSRVLGITPEASLDL